MFSEFDYLSNQIKSPIVKWNEILFSLPKMMTISHIKVELSDQKWKKVYLPTVHVSPTQMYYQMRYAPHETHIISVDMSQANIIWIHPILAHRNKFGNHLKNPSIKRTFLFLTFYDSRDIQEESQIIYLLWHCDGVLVGDTLTNGTMWCSVVCVWCSVVCVCTYFQPRESCDKANNIFTSMHLLCLSCVW